MLVDFPLRRISQWQSQTVARWEGECPAPKTNQNTYIVTHLEIEFTYRPQISERLLPLIKQYSNIVPLTSAYHKVDIVLTQNCPFLEHFSVA